MAEKMEDHFATMGLNWDATTDEIKKAYKKMALKYHPDRTKGDAKKEKIFIKIKSAYEVLSDDKERAKLTEQYRKKSSGLKRAAEDDRKKSAKRRKWKDDLVAKEKAAEEGRANRQEVTAKKQADKRRQTEINKLRELNRQKTEEFNESFRGGSSSTNSSSHGDSGPSTSTSGQYSSTEFEMNMSQQALDRSELRKKQVKVKWSRKSQQEGESFSEDSLAGIFREYGMVVAVKMGEKRKSATLTFETEGVVDAIIAAEYELVDKHKFKEIERCSHGIARYTSNPLVDPLEEKTDASKNDGSKNGSMNENAGSGVQNGASDRNTTLAKHLQEEEEVLQMMMLAAQKQQE